MFFYFKTQTITQEALFLKTVIKTYLFVKYHEC